jgi:hypothetical protein
LVVNWPLIGSLPVEAMDSSPSLCSSFNAYWVRYAPSSSGTKARTDSINQVFPAADDD